jgi:hypothetical protein
MPASRNVEVWGGIDSDEPQCDEEQMQPLLLENILDNDAIVVVVIGPTPISPRKWEAQGIL